MNKLYMVVNEMLSNDYSLKDKVRLITDDKEAAFNYFNSIGYTAYVINEDFSMEEENFKEE